MSGRLLLNFVQETELRRGRIKKWMRVQRRPTCFLSLVCLLCVHTPLLHTECIRTSCRFLLKWRVSKHHCDAFSERHEINSSLRKGFEVSRASRAHLCTLQFREWFTQDLLKLWCITWKITEAFVLSWLLSVPWLEGKMEFGGWRCMRGRGWAGRKVGRNEWVWKREGEGCCLNCFPWIISVP